MRWTTHTTYDRTHRSNPTNTTDAMTSFAPFHRRLYHRCQRKCRTDVAACKSHVDRRTCGLLGASTVSSSREGGSRVPHSAFEQKRRGCGEIRTIGGRGIFGGGRVQVGTVQVRDIREEGREVADVTAQQAPSTNTNSSRFNRNSLWTRTKFRRWRDLFWPRFRWCLCMINKFQRRRAPLRSKSDCD